MTPLPEPCATTSCSHAQHAEPGIALVRDDGRRLDVDHGIDGGFRRMDKRVAVRDNPCWPVGWASWAWPLMWCDWRDAPQRVNLR